MKIFLDDVRDPSNCLSYMHTRIGADNVLYKEGWYVVRNYDQFVDAIIKYKDDITHVSFDHDLADAHYHESMYQDGKVYMQYIETTGEKTGYDCAVWMKEHYRFYQTPLPIMFIHSMNPVGTQRIIDLFK